MKISDLVKSLEKIKSKHGDLPIAFEVSDDDCCPIKKIHVKKIYMTMIVQFQKQVSVR